MDTLAFSTKAHNLERLVGRLTSASILPLCHFSRGSWEKDSENCLANIHKVIKNNGNFIVRSSSNSEDGNNASNAGAFLSIPNIQKINLDRAINDVFASYHSIDASDEVLIQPMLHNVIMSGVAFSHDAQTCGPYRTINWSEGMSTSDVTSGNGNTHLWYHAASSEKVKNKEISPVLDLVEELLIFFGGSPIDCEFAFSEKFQERKLWLLQVRPLLLQRTPESVEQQGKKLLNIKSKCLNAMRPHPLLLGESTAYGVMPDWNPAEIIGIRPKQLASSLYRELITDFIWSEQRYKYGYRDVRGFPLLREFYGLPYVDVRVSFNSFIPADVDENLAEKLANHYMKKLKDNPSLHDKVEFKIVYSCYTFDLRERLKPLLEEGFHKSELVELENSLLKITNGIIEREQGLWKKEKLELYKLKFQQKKYISKLGRVRVINSLLENTKKHGTLPFAGLARAGFVAVQLLQSLVKKGIFTRKDYDKFMTSCCTISTRIAQDKIRLGKEKFLKKYGHLRPGTYSISSPRYDEEPDLYFDWATTDKVKKVSRFSLTKCQENGVNQLICNSGLSIDAKSLMSFIKAAIEYREFAKFLFTRNLSDCLKCIEDLGDEYGIPKKDMAFCNINAIKEAFLSGNNVRNSLASSIRKGKKSYEDTLNLVLPPLITDLSDIFSFKWPMSSPNYITQRRVIANTVKHTERENLAGKIVFMPNADPGFDWIFLQPISGLVTTWGGANSHMAIRAGELGIPAVIGAGEILYEKWSKANTINLDCGKQLVEVLR